MPRRLAAGGGHGIKVPARPIEPRCTGAAADAMEVLGAHQDVAALRGLPWHNRGQRPVHLAESRIPHPHRADHAAQPTGRAAPRHGVRGRHSLAGAGRQSSAGPTGQVAHLPVMPGSGMAIKTVRPAEANLQTPQKARIGRTPHLPFLSPIPLEGPQPTLQALFAESDPEACVEVQ